jgi:hypothetical protein
VTEGHRSEVPSREDLLREVVPHLELTGIHFLELSARRLDYLPDSDDLPSMLDELEEDDPVQMGVAARQTDEQLLVRVQGGINTDSVHVRITAAATFAKLQPVDLDGPTTSVFIERVAIMSMYPFIRQAVHDMSTRLGAPATLHLLRAGQLSMTDEEYDGAPAQPEEAPAEES